MPDSPAPRPMLPSDGAPPQSGDWRYEYKWDGMRALITIDQGRIRVFARSGADHTAAYPELADLVRDLDEVTLDGEIITLDARSRPSFTLLSRRFGVTEPLRVAELVTRIPITYMAFDILRLGRQDIREQAYTARRQILESLPLTGPHCMVPPTHTDGPTTMESARAVGLEGIIAKRADSPYRPGRSTSWIRIKPARTADVVVGGWWGSATHIRSLLVGETTERGDLGFRGRVGSGITGAAHNELLALLTPLVTHRNPFAAVPAADAKDVTWVDPLLIVEVKYTEITPAGRLRQPRYVRYRPDKTIERINRRP